MAKPTRSALLLLGLPAPAAAQPSELAERVDAATGLIYLRAHGRSDDDEVSLRLISSTTSGAVASALPTALAEGTTYYVRVATADAFRLATAVSPAAAITSYVSAGSGRFALLVDPGDALDQAIDDAWDTVLASCTAHGGDVEAPIIEIASRYLAAQLYIAHATAGDPALAESFAGIASIYDKVYAPKLDDYFRGVPVRGATDATPNTSEGSPRHRVLGASAPTATSWGTTSADIV